MLGIEEVFYAVKHVDIIKMNPELSQLAPTTNQKVFWVCSGESAVVFAGIKNAHRGA